MQTINLDPSIASKINIGPVFKQEDLNVYFKSKTADWAGDFECKIYNSFQKNTVFAVANNLTIVDDLMTFRIAPEVQGLPAGTLYYEISSVADKRLLFKGTLKIEK